MQIELRTCGLLAELSFKSGNLKFEEDVAEVKKGIGYIPIELIEKFITIARDMNQFNDKSDVHFVKMIYDAFLNDTEREEFLQLISES